MKSPLSLVTYSRTSMRRVVVPRVLTYNIKDGKFNGLYGTPNRVIDDTKKNRDLMKVKLITNKSLLTNYGYK